MKTAWVVAAVAALGLGWAVGESAPLGVRTLGFEAVNDVAWSGDGRYVAVAGSHVHLVDAATWGVVRTLVGHKGSVFSVAFSPDGKLLASGAYDRTVKLWDVAAGTEVRTLVGHTWDVYSVAFSPDGKLLASGSEDGTVKLWDVAAGTEVRTLVGLTRYPVYSVAFSPDGKLLASGSVDGTVKLWDVASVQAG